jgi:hypothetical protein
LDHVVECLEGSVKSFVHCSHLALRQMAVAHNALAAILNLEARISSVPQDLVS